MTPIRSVSWLLVAAGLVVSLVTTGCGSSADGAGNDPDTGAPYDDVTSHIDAAGDVVTGVDQVDATGSDLPSQEDAAGILVEEDPWPQEVVATLDMSADYSPYSPTIIGKDLTGAWWMAYPACGAQGPDCTQPGLAVAHGVPGGEWEHTVVTSHSFWSVAMVVPTSGVPRIAFVDGEEVALVVATVVDGEVTTETLDVDVVGSGDVVALAKKEDRVYLAHGNKTSEDATTVFRLIDGAWSTVTPSVPEGSLLSTTSLALDDTYTLWIATRGQEVVQVRSLAPGSTTWVDEAPLPLPGGPSDTQYDSMLLTSQTEVCFAGKDADFHLLVTCERPPVDAWEPLAFEETKVFGAPSLVEGWDQGLGVLFDHWQDDRLILLEKSPDGTSWMLRLLTDEPAYGISSAVGADGHLAVSFVTCDDEECRLVLATEP